MEHIMERPSAESDELRKKTDAIMKMNVEKGTPMERDYAREIAEIELRTEAAHAEEKKQYPGGKHYEGRSTD